LKKKFLKNRELLLGGRHLEYCIEAENKEEAQKIAVDRIDWGDVELTCGVYEEKKDNLRKKYKIKAKGEN
jgi:hypothetical protein